MPNQPEVVRDATERTRPLGRAAAAQAARRPDQALFAIVQGGLDAELRAWCAGELRRLDFAGYAVGGLSVGETPAEMYRMLDATVPELPADRPRYLMGVGRPEDLLEAIRRGIDLFDCVMPTRNGRNAMAFTDAGPVRLRNLQYERDAAAAGRRLPLCPACRRSRGYLRHLFMAGEMLGPILLSIHNLTYYQRLMAGARAAIERDQFEAFRAGEAARLGFRPRRANSALSGSWGSRPLRDPSFAPQVSLAKAFTPRCYTQVGVRVFVPEGRLIIAQQFTAGSAGQLGPATKSRRDF